MSAGDTRMATRTFDLAGCRIGRTLRMGIGYAVFRSKTADLGGGPGLCRCLGLAALHAFGRIRFAAASRLESCLEVAGPLLYKARRAFGKR